MAVLLLELYGYSLVPEQHGPSKEVNYLEPGRLEMQIKEFLLLCLIMETPWLGVETSTTPTLVRYGFGLAQRVCGHNRARNWWALDW